MAIEIKKNAEQKLSLETLFVLLEQALDKKEKNVREQLDKLDGAAEKVELNQTQLLAIQTRLNEWNNISGLATGIMHAVGDALKAKWAKFPQGFS